MKKLGIVALVLTLVLTIPILFILSRNTVNTNQFILIVSVVLISKGGKLAETVISHRSLIPNYNASPRQVVFLGNDLAVYTVGVGIEVFHQPVD